MTAADDPVDVAPSEAIDAPEVSTPGAGGDAPEHGQTRRQRLREAAIQAEYATGDQEDTEQQARRNIVIRIATITIGFIVLLAGLGMMVLPGPGIVGVLAGLGILSRELPWAERMIEYVQKKARLDELKKQPRWVQALMWVLTILAVTSSLVYFTVIR